MTTEPANLHPIPALELCWLVELFLPYSGNSTGFYHTGFTDIGGASRTTQNPHEAKRYTTAEEATRVATKLDSKQGEWRAIEHGFYTDATLTDVWAYHRDLAVSSELTADERKRHGNMARLLHVAISEAKTVADPILNAGSEGAIHADMEARYERERARFHQVLHLMGETDEAVAEAMDKLNGFIEVHPSGSLVLTHGPFDEPVEKPRTTFHNLLAMWWQDDDYGSQFNELLWMRP